MRIMRKVPIHMNQVSARYKFVGIRYSSSIDLESGYRLESIGFTIYFDMRLNIDDLLYKGILQEPIIDALCLFLPKQISYRIVTEPKRLFYLLFIIIGIKAIKVVVKAF